MNQEYPPVSGKLFAEEILKFIQVVESLSESFPRVMGVANAHKENAAKELTDFLEANSTETKDVGGIKHYTVVGNLAPKAHKLDRSARNAQTAFELLFQSFLTSVVSQYDSFFGRLIRLVLIVKPEILQGSERTLSFSDLARFGSIDEARESLIEKEVETVGRKNLSDQFQWLESKLGTTLRNLEAWPTFVELVERRNLYVHADGIISNHYLAVCRAHKVDLPDHLKAGIRLGMNTDYFKNACQCILEIAIKLVQVVWRKLLPSELDKADSSYNQVCFEILQKGDYKLAQRLLDFACRKELKHGNEEIRRYLVLNRAQAYKWDGDAKLCAEILGEEDWTACSDKFQIAVAVLRDDFQTAAKVMERLANDQLLQTGLKEWPIFKEFRKTQLFQDKFQQVFGIPFSVDIKTAESSDQHAADKK